MTLTEFLLARIAEDEATARAGDRVGVYPGMFDDHFGARTGDGERGAYAARFDPARVLAGCERDRRIVERLSRHRVSSEYLREAGVPQTALAANDTQHVWDNGTLRLLALPYADHPDYDEEWRP